MQRTIIPEEQHEEVQNTEQQVQVNESQTVNKTIDVNDRVVISSYELEQLFHEWDCTGKKDLIINESIADRIQEYLAYQERIKPLKIKLAEEQFGRFIVDKVQREHEIKIYIDSVFVTKISMFAVSDYNWVCMYFGDFRDIVLCACKNPFAFYAYQGKEYKTKINVKGWIMEHGGSFEEDENEYKIRISLPT